MQLRNARVCLDCEELHEDQRCPVCASESFAFLARWVPSSERRTKTRPPSAQKPAISSLDSSSTSRLGKAALSLTGLVAVVWWWGRGSGPNQTGRIN
jgi:hypothetical protein